MNTKIISLALNYIPNVYNFLTLHEKLIISCLNIESLRQRKHIQIDNYISLETYTNLLLTQCKFNIQKIYVFNIKDLLDITRNNLTNITYLRFNDYFNQPIIIPSWIKNIEFGFKFNQSISLPNSVTHLKFGAFYNQSTRLPNSITHLEFGSRFNQSISLPNSVTHLTFDYTYNHSVRLPNSITHLTFGSLYNQPTPLPNSITHLTFGSSYNQSTPLPNSITHLTFGLKYNQPTLLPSTLTHLIFTSDSEYNQPTSLPVTLKHLVLGLEYNQSTQLPENMIFLYVYNKYLKINIPKNCSDTNSLIYTKLCKSVIYNTACKFYEKCIYAHSIDQLRIIDCKYDDNCVRNDCIFKHSKENMSQYINKHATN